MKILTQIGLIMFFGFAGELISRIAPVGMPASLLALLLMLASLRLKILRPEHAGRTAEFLSANMSFLFIPAAVNIIEHYELVRRVILPLLLICIITTALTFFVTYFTVSFCTRKYS